METFPEQDRRFQPVKEIVSVKENGKDLRVHYSVWNRKRFFIRLASPCISLPPSSLSISVSSGSLSTIHPTIPLLPPPRFFVLSQEGETPCCGWLLKSYRSGILVPWLSPSSSRKPFTAIYNVWPVTDLFHYQQPALAADIHHVSIRVHVSSNPISHL